MYIVLFPSVGNQSKQYPNKHFMLSCYGSARPDVTAKPPQLLDPRVGNIAISPNLDPSESAPLRNHHKILGIPSSTQQTSSSPLKAIGNRGHVDVCGVEGDDLAGRVGHGGVLDGGLSSGLTLGSG